MSNITNAIVDLAAGKTALLIDDLSQVHCGYLIHAAELITEKDVCTLVNDAGGLSLAAVSEARLNFLSLRPVLGSNPSSTPDLTVSVEARHGVTTGISASDRARTLQALSTTRDPRRDLVTPGHVFPVIAKTGGVLVRHGAAEAAVDLLHLAKLSSVCAMSHCLDSQGELASVDDLIGLAQKRSFSVLRISEVIEHRLTKQPIIEQTAKTSVELGENSILESYCFISNVDNSEHLAFRKLNKNQSLDSGQALVRVQSEKLFSDVMGIDSGNARKGLVRAIEKLKQAEQNSVFVYIRHPKSKSLRTISFEEESAASSTRETENTQFRELGIGAQILRQLGVREITLLSNSSRKITGLEPFGITITDRKEY